MMRISLSGLKALDQQVPTQDVEDLYESDWLLGEVPYEIDADRPHVRPVIIDPKAARMFELYARQGTSFALQNLRPYLIMVVWLGYIQIKVHVKRAFDLFLVLSILPFMLPIMLITALAIKLDSPGPIIFKQERVGKWCRRFTCYKFRSMYNGADAMKTELITVNEADEVVFKMKHDPRVTRVGYFIRKFSIDELPQLFNVIRGDMSLVGPRPPVPVELESYPFDTFRRLDTIPGLTGLQQVSGRSDLPFKRWVALDVEYIRDQSLKKDIEILFKTIPVAISGKGAY
jgi:lipopolysaccharide/colanic/teichoic acid biosynthesis glycosyltransferase